MNNPLHKEPKASPKDFFLWLGIMATLYVSAISLVVLLFEYINILFPDPLDYYVDPYRGAIRFAIASLIVIFPLYIYLMRKVNVDARKHPAKREIKVRKWIVYLSLFAASLTMVIDLIVLINTFLGGEITTQFILKVLTVLVVIGGAFLYYFYDLKGHWQIHESKSKIIGATVAGLILIAIISGFLIMGSPATQRLLRFDQEKVEDLSNIQWQLINFYQNKGLLPESLEETKDSLSGFVAPLDRETGEEYVYEKTDLLTFNLCATFNEESFNLGKDRTERPKYGFSEENWDHEAGYVCFEREIDPELYPLLPVRGPTFR